jgi:Tfp pilus assembly protein PilN
MIEFNLLPPEEKAEIMGQKAFKKVLFWGFSSLIFVLIFLALLSSIWWYLLIQLKSIQSIVNEMEASPQNKTFNDIKKEIDGINQRMQSFDKLQIQGKDYSFYWQKLTELSVSGITFKHISINDTKVVLEGRAATREILLSFKDALENSAYFQNINIPLSDFLKQNNIDFSFNFELEQQQTK